jgi:hypothetical protein
MKQEISNSYVFRYSQPIRNAFFNVTIFSSVRFPSSMFVLNNLSSTPAAAHIICFVLFVFVSLRTHTNCAKENYLIPQQEKPYYPHLKLWDWIKQMLVFIALTKTKRTKQIICTVWCYISQNTVSWQHIYRASTMSS